MSIAPNSQFVFVGSKIKKLTFTNPFINLPANAKYTVEVDYSVDSFTKDENGYRGIITLNVKMKIRHKRNISSLSIDLEGCFDLSDDSIADDIFEKMLQLNGVTMLYSIARSIIQSITSQSFLDGSVALPMINVVSLYDSKKQDEVIKYKKG